MFLHSIQVGKKQSYGDAEQSGFFEKLWETGMYKTELSGAVIAGKEGLEGDEQADTKVHGGVDKAICVYVLDHLDFWREQLGIELGAGAFGENFSVTGVDEEEVCIGDIYTAGDCCFQVTQPRQPCWKLARRWGEKTLPAIVQETGKTGWYLRVLKEGSISAGVELCLQERPHPEWTIARANQLMHKDKKNRQLAGELAVLEPLSESWKSTLTKRSERDDSSSEELRLKGE